jgi:hypothetical protein
LEKVEIKEYQPVDHFSQNVRMFILTFSLCCVLTF